MIVVWLLFMWGGWVRYFSRVCWDVFTEVVGRLFAGTQQLLNKRSYVCRFQPREDPLQPYNNHNTSSLNQVVLWRIVRNAQNDQLVMSQILIERPERTPTTESNLLIIREVPLGTSSRKKPCISYHYGGITFVYICFAT